MREYTIDDRTFEVPDCKAVEEDDGSVVFEVTEGRFNGVQFRYDSIRMSETEDDLMTFELYTSLDETTQEFQEFSELCKDMLLAMVYDYAKSKVNSQITDSVT